MKKSIIKIILWTILINLIIIPCILSFIKEWNYIINMTDNVNDIEILSGDIKNIFLRISLIVEFMLFILIMILTKTPKKIKIYNKDPESVIEPIIAEAIIDRKIGTKELIMSCITELICRKKLKNIRNDAVEIIDLENISEYERKIIELVFEGKNKIYFNEIKEIFIKDNEKTKEIYNKLISIKKGILEKIIDYRIYSEWGEKIIKLIKCFAITMFVGIFGLMLGTSFYMPDFIFLIVIGIWMPFCLIGTIIDVFNRDNKIKVKSKKTEILVKKILWSAIIEYFIVSIILMCISKNIIYIVLLILTILNIIILSRTKLHCFTTTGRIEYKKAFALKKYIEDYGLMEERELDSVIVWDEYLAYACAFGITNKVTKKYDEKNLNLNILLQKLDNF